MKNTIDDVSDSVPLVESGTAIESMRNSDFDVYSAYGELVDNSLQAEAATIRIQINYKPKTPSSPSEPIEKFVVGDDGKGMDGEVLHRCLQLGYSSRYNDRNGIGRFGVGATLAAINQCKRVELYSMTAGGNWHYTYFDLDDIASKKMNAIPVPEEKSLPKEYRELVGSKSGTVVIWSKYDRQPDDGGDIERRFRIWLGRTYRRFITRKGIKIVLNGEVVSAIDPLYIEIEKTQFPGDPKAFEFPPMKISWPIPPEDQKKGGTTKADITIRMSLLPEEFRNTSGSGGSKSSQERHIDENEGISILRNDREVFYDHIPHWSGSPFAEIDRWWGCEISFDAVLDKEFTVKNIKRGAVPVKALKKALAEKINPTRGTALERVREVWAKAKAAASVTQTDGGLVTGHEEAEQAAKRTPTAKGVLDAGKDIDKESAKVSKEWLAHQDERVKAAWEAKFKSQPFTIVDADWKGPEFVETSHLGGADVLRYNARHPFFTELAAIRAALTANGQDASDAARLRVLIDLLLISHAKAETMIDPKIQWPPEQLLETLRMQWGQYLNGYIATYKRENNLS